MSNLRRIHAWIFALCSLVSVVGQAAEPIVAWRVQADQDHAALSFRWSAPVTVNVTENGQELLLEFNRTVGVLPLEAIARDLRPYLTNVRFGFDTVLLEVSRPAQQRVFVTDYGVVVEFSIEAAVAAKAVEVNERLNQLRALALVETGDPCAARRQLQETVDEQWADAETHMAMGRANQLCGDRLSALQHYDAVGAEHALSETALTARRELLREYGSAMSLESWQRRATGGDEEDAVIVGGQWLLPEFGIIRADWETRWVSADELVSTTGNLEDIDAIRHYGSAMVTHVRELHDFGVGLVSSDDSVGFRGKIESRTYPLLVGFDLGFDIPALDYVEGVVNRATKDTVLFRANYRPMQSVSGGGWISGNAYSLPTHDGVARSLAVGAHVAAPLSRFWSGAVFRYSLDAEYVSDPWTVVGLGGAEVAPLPLQDREVHAFALETAASIRPDWDYVVSAGYTFDRLNDAGLFLSASMTYRGFAPLDVVGLAASSMDSSRSDTERVTQVGLRVMYGFN